MLRLCMSFYSFAKLYSAYTLFMWVCVVYVLCVFVCVECRTRGESQGGKAQELAVCLRCHRLSVGKHKKEKIHVDESSNR